MISILIPSTIQLSQASGFLKIKGPKGELIKKIGNLNFNRLKTIQGTFIFVKGISIKEQIIALSQIQRFCFGVIRGFRCRLRLSGVGFRTTSTNQTKIKTRFSTKKQFYTKKYRQKRFEKFISKEVNLINLKLGYSHECIYPYISSTAISIQTSRIEGRTKGRLISIQGQDHCQVNQVASEIRSFRKPDAYKGKGILYDKEILRLKKGKRQA